MPWGASRRCATLPAMEPRRQSVPEAGAYRMVQGALIELKVAERSLTLIEQAAPDAERAVHLGAIRAVIAQLETFVQTPMKN